MNFENKFDPHDAMSTPLYQTATFKQVQLIEYFTNCVLQNCVEFENSQLNYKQK